MWIFLEIIQGTEALLNSWKYKQPIVALKLANSHTFKVFLKNKIKIKKERKKKKLKWIKWENFTLQAMTKFGQE